MTTPYYSTATARIIDQLSHELGQGVLLYGPAGIGLGFAAAEIARAHTKEVVTIRPDDRGTISIDVIRELYTVGRTKAGTTLFVIDDADAMGREAQNALLKLLEEPVASLHFILTSHAPERLLPTIRSRVQEYCLTPISSEQSEALIAQQGITDPTQRAQLMFIAEGLPADLTRYTADTTAFKSRSSIVRDARTFLQGSREERLLLSAGYKDRAQTIGLVHDMAKLLRRSVEATPTPEGADSLELLLATESALLENASVRLSLTSLSVAL